MRSSTEGGRNGLAKMIASEPGGCIILVRHGKPNCDNDTPVAGSAFAQWLRTYNEAPLDPAAGPPWALSDQARSVSLIVASPLRRSLESADLLAPSVPRLTEAFFREVGTPGSFTSAVALNPHFWSRLARAAWLCGWSPDCESFSEARARARLAATQLIHLAEQYGSVMLVGHGVFNLLIARNLRRLRWAGPGWPRGSYWWSVTFLPSSDLKPSKDWASACKLSRGARAGDS